MLNYIIVCTIIVVKHYFSTPSNHHGTLHFAWSIAWLGLKVCNCKFEIAPRNLSKKHALVLVETPKPGTDYQDLNSDL
jgi:uncharacterized membrane protein